MPAKNPLALSSLHVKMVTMDGCTGIFCSIANIKTKKPKFTSKGSTSIIYVYRLLHTKGKVSSLTLWYGNFLTYIIVVEGEENT